jgi:lipoprotein-anchoring transpeptidase ErfK/SrfK
LQVHAAPDGPVIRNLVNPQPMGAPLTLLVRRQDGPWLQVFLPVRPNGSTGWVRVADVRTAQVPYRVEISTAAHRLTLYRSGRLVATFAAATGTGGTPTPLGSFFLTELLAPTNPGYGPYAYGLSAFSTVLTSFGGGPGQIGLHGTSEANSIGHSSSHGCIRLSNGDITTLSRVLPLGTPVNIT